jgi:hypothetical protein
MNKAVGAVLALLITIILLLGLYTFMSEEIVESMTESLTPAFDQLREDLNAHTDEAANSPINNRVSGRNNENGQ